MNHANWFHKCFHAILPHWLKLTLWIMKAWIKESLKIESESCIVRSNHPEVFLGKGVLKICSKFTGEHWCRNGVSIKLPSKFIEITPRHGCSLVNLLHIFITPFPKNTSGRLLLHCIKRSSWDKSIRSCKSTLLLYIQCLNQYPNLRQQSWSHHLANLYLLKFNNIDTRK